MNKLAALASQVAARRVHLNSTRMAHLNGKLTSKGQKQRDQIKAEYFHLQNVAREIYKHDPRGAVAAGRDFQDLVDRLTEFREMGSKRLALVAV
jgi:hypothetical protein